MKRSLEARRKQSSLPLDHHHLLFIGLTGNASYSEFSPNVLSFCIPSPFSLNVALKAVAIPPQLFSTENPSFSRNLARAACALNSKKPSSGLSLMYRESSRRGLS